MPDHNFEKQVEKILGGLQMQPDDKVWTSVKDAIAEPKNKRRPIWIWFAVVAIAVGSYFLLTKQNDKTDSKNIVETKQENKTEIQNQKQVTTNDVNIDSIENIHRLEAERIVQSKHSSKGNVRSTTASKKTSEESIAFSDQLKTSQQKNNSIEKDFSITRNNNVAVTKEQKQDTLEINTEIAKSESPNNEMLKDKKTDTAVKKSQPLIEKPAEVVSVLKTVPPPKKKWQTGIMIYGGYTGYSEGLNLFKAEASGNTYAAPGNNVVNITRVTQHPGKGFHYGAGFIIQRNFKKFSIQSGFNVEHTAFTNVVGNYVQMYNTTTTSSAAQGGYNLISSSFQVSKTNYRFTGFAVPVLLKSNFISGTKNSLGWSIGTQQAIAFNRNRNLAFLNTAPPTGQYSSSNSIGKTVMYQPSLMIGLDYKRTGKLNMEISPYLDYQLRSVKTTVNVPVNLYKAGISVKYFFK
jgi:hypothetical protein